VEHPSALRDVLVIGSGPAGTTAAGLLASWNHDVVLITRPDPTAGWLAESVPSSAFKLLDAVGLREAFEGGDFFPNGGNTVWWAERAERTEPFLEGSLGVHLERAALESPLLAAAVARGVDVRRDAPVRDVRRDSDRWITASADVATASRWVLDASGRTGVLGRRARVEDRPTGTLALVGRWGRTDGWTGDDRTHTLIESHAEGWVWSVPLSEETRCVTAMIDPRHPDLERTGDIDAMLRAEVAKAPRLAARLEGATYEGDARACPASLYSAESFVGDHALLVGDAGSFIDPLSSYGVKKALSSAWLAAVATHTAIMNPAMYRTALEFFDAREREVYRRYRELSIPFFEEAAEVYGTGFWTARAEAARRAGGQAAGGPKPPTPGAPIDPADSFDPSADADALIAHRDVREAYEEIRRRPEVTLRRGATLSHTDRPLIRDRLIVLDRHLTSAVLETPVRYVRNVDLDRLVEVGPHHAQVPDIYEAYNRGQTPAALPDFLAALAVALGKGFLELPDWRPTA
jgi:flavin-dependent dehydrogenase